MDFSLSPAAENPSAAPPAVGHLLIYTRYASPIILLAVLVVAFLAHSIVTASDDQLAQPDIQATGPGGKPLPPKPSASARARQVEPPKDLSPARKLLVVWLSVGTIVTFVGNAALIILHTILARKENWWCGDSVVIYVVASFFVYTLLLISLVDTKPAPTVVHVSTWMVALILETVLLGMSLAFYSSGYHDMQAGNSHGGGRSGRMTIWEVLEILLDAIRILFLLALILFYAFFVSSGGAQLRRAIVGETGDVAERTSLLDGRQVENGTSHGQAYGTGSPDSAQKAEVSGWIRPEKLPSKSWWEYIRGYSLFFPYLWPAKSSRLQLTVVICFVLVMLARVVNVLVPHQVKVITDELAGENGQDARAPWGSIVLYIVYRLLQGNNGFLGAIRAVLWVPIGQYSYQELSTASFEHVHGLSLDFHLGKRTGEVLSALGKGNSINNFLEQVTFQVLPMLIDLGVAIVYFLVAFDAYYALVVAVVTFVYLYLTIRLAQWRVEIRREMVNFSRQEDAVKNDSMVSYETVKYFNAEQYEFQRYRSAVQDYQKAEYKVLTSLNVLNVSQNMVFMLGLLVTCFIVAYQVSTGQRTVGKFAELLTYMAQLQSPLNYFGTFYRSIQSAMINSERMLELFKERPSVVDTADAEELPSCQGEIRFNHVKFAYDFRKPALDGLDFRCAPGTTTALVGESGGGKSTVFRLLFRFYNLNQGSIQIDGHDVNGITIDSLRRHIGVVPQDTVLFNETIMYNLKYANQSATEAEVYDACRAASIHEKILSFPDGYNSRVGERGLKLSGGEKQRIAIARTILKDPRVILLDEATAALDSETEQHIQTALEKLSQGRTTLVIAHRLSTITVADQILVLHAGRVAERGTHHELLALNQRYANMWRKQIRAQQAADEAKVLTDRAERLRKEIENGESANQSDNDSVASSGSGHNGMARVHRGDDGSQGDDDGDGKPPSHP